MHAAQAAPRTVGVKGRKLVILGVDGADPRILQEYMDEGILPNFSRLAASGGLSSVRTTMPPQSPVAWSSFITGMDPGGHGIFDFVHRRPGKTIVPYFSMSRTESAQRRLECGDWVLPLSGGKVEQLRQGTAFWQMLEAHGIPTMVVKMPANFPPVPSPGRSLSGMGTPDFVGSMGGEFSLFAETLPPGHRDFTGGKAYRVRRKNHRIDAQLVGPDNVFRREEKQGRRSRRGGKKQYTNPKLKADFSVFADPHEQLAKFVVGDREFILKKGEWSDWIQIEFTAVPGLVHVSAVCRFHLQDVHPTFKLYVTPLQINPADPAMPISTPEEWSREICDEIGPFYTQGLPADTKALSHGVLSPGEFWDLTQFILEERKQLLDYSLRHFDHGLLFFYVSTIDESSHMLWRFVDDQHPGYDPDAGMQDSLKELYIQIDTMLGDVLDRIDGRTSVMVMSDHGFSPFYWGMNLNSWLAENGFIRLRSGGRGRHRKLWQDVDWTQSTAYAAGLNGLYVNLKGREANGIVRSGAEYEELLDRLESALLAARDPRNSGAPISRLVRTHRDFSPAQLAIAPDIVVGYSRGYRSSWENPLGEFSTDVYQDNLDAWSADHCMDADCVPASLVTDLSILTAQPAMTDLTVSVLEYFGIGPGSDMIGANCLKSV